MITYSNKQIIDYIDKLRYTLKQPDSFKREQELKKLEKIHNSSKVLQDCEYMAKVLEERNE